MSDYIYKVIEDGLEVTVKRFKIIKDLELYWRIVRNNKMYTVSKSLGYYLSKNDAVENYLETMGKVIKFKKNELEKTKTLRNKARKLYKKEAVIIEHGRINFDKLREQIDGDKREIEIAEED